MAIPVLIGSVDCDVTFKVVDSTTFEPETGVTSASAGLALWYRKGAAGAMTAITEGDHTNLTDAHSDGKIKHISDGLYRLSLPDAAIPTSEGEVTTFGGTVTGMQVLGGAIVGAYTIGAPAGASVSADIAAIDSAVGAIGSGTGAALNFAASTDNTGGALKGVTFVGSQASTFAETAAEDSTRHAITHTGNAIDIVYKFSVGPGRNVAKVVWKGYLTNSNDTITVQAYNGSTWDTRKTIVGVNTTTNSTQDIDLLSVHTLTGAEAGDVYLRFVCSGQTSPVLNTDSLLAQAQNLGQTVGYADGAIWVDTVNGSAGTTAFVHGTADNPVLTWADALTLAAAVGLARFRIAGGSTITLTASADSYALLGDALWTLALGGQSIASAFIDHAAVSGTSTGANAIFNDCRIDPGTSTAGASFVRCGFNTSVGSPFIAAAAGQYTFVDCVSVVAGAGTPHFTWSGTGGTTGVNFRRWSGGTNQTLDSNVTMTLEVVTGGGQTITTGGGAVEIRGTTRTLTIATSGSSVTQFAGVTGPVAISGTGGTVRLYGVTGAITDTSTGTTVTQAQLSQANPVGSVTGAVGSVATGGITAASIATDAIDADALAADAVAEIADGVWDEALAGHAGVGSSGAALSAAGSAGDPWSTALPGAYASGTAGNIIGNIASTVWNRLTSALTTSGSIGAYIVSKLGGTTITVTAPVASGGNVTIYIGDDYSNTDSRALDWTSSGWPNLTSATSITLVAMDARTTGADWSITGTAPTAGVGSQTVRFQPTAAETAQLREGSGHKFQIEAVLSSGRIVTLVAATLTATGDIA